LPILNIFVPQVGQTPYTTLNPRIKADWRDLREKFEDAAKESQHLQEDHFGPKIRGKALKGEHLGHQSFNTTAKYRKVSGKEHKDWYERLWEKKES